MNTNEAKRKCEMLFVRLLTALLPDQVFLTEKGGDDDATDDPKADANDLTDPPYIVVGINELERMLPKEDTWAGEATFTIVNSIKDAKSAAHSRLVDQVEAALNQIDRGVYGADGVVLHGLDLMTCENTSGEDSYADVLRAELGFSTQATLPPPPPPPVLPTLVLRYSDNPATYTSSVPITPNAPTVTGGTIYSFAADAMPDGLSLDADTGIISGTPGTPHAQHVQITLTDTNGRKASTTLQITVNPPPGLPLAGYLLDLDGDNAGPLGSVLAIWPDASPNHNDLTQPDPARQPVVVAGVKGHLAVSFDGVDDFLMNATDPSINPFFTVFAVVTLLPGFDTSVGPITAGGPGTFSGITIYQNVFSLQIGPSAPISGGVPPVAGQLYVLRLDANGPTTKLYANGVDTLVDGTQLPGPFSMKGFVLASNSQQSGNRYLKLLAHRLAVYPLLSSADASAVEQYLTARYGP